MKMCGPLSKICRDLTLLLALAACQSIPDQQRKLYVEQCSPYLVYESVEILRNNTPTASVIVDEAKSECNCRRYKYSVEFVGPIANTLKTHPLEYCQKMVGERPDDYGKKTSWFGDLRKDLRDAIK